MVVPHVTPLVGAEVERSASGRVVAFTGGEEDSALENGRDRVAIALAKLAVLERLETWCSGEVE